MKNPFRRSGQRPANDPAALWAYIDAVCAAVADAGIDSVGTEGVAFLRRVLSKAAADGAAPEPHLEVIVDDNAFAANWRVKNLPGEPWRLRMSWYGSPSDARQAQADAVAARLDALYAESGIR